MLSRTQARKIIDKYANGYADDFLHLCTIKTPTLSAVSRREEQGVADCAFEMRNGVKDPSAVFPPFSADWSITKEGKRCIVYPMLAIEDGLTNYDDGGST